MIDAADSAPLPPIAPKPQEQAWEERLADLLREVARTERERDAMLVLRGGTAGRLGHGLTRPSRDIDADIVGDCNVWNVFAQAAERAGMTAIAEAEPGHALKGKLTLNDPRIGTTAITVDIRQIRDPERTAAIRNGTLSERRNGIRMYIARELAEQKIGMFTSRSRRRARDRYDIAWWLRNRIDVVPDHTRAAIDRRLRSEPEAKVVWDTSHRNDAVLARVKAEHVHDSLLAALDNDPAVLQDRNPEGQLEIAADGYEGALVEWRSDPDSNRSTIIAELENDQELESFMVSRGLWKREDLPRHFEALADARAEARTLDAVRETETAEIGEGDRWSEATVACTRKGYFVQGTARDGEPMQTVGPLGDVDTLERTLREHGMLVNARKSKPTLQMLEQLGRRAVRRGEKRAVTVTEEGTAQAERPRTARTERLLAAIVRNALEPTQHIDGEALDAGRASEKIIVSARRARVRIQAVNRALEPR